MMGRLSSLGGGGLWGKADLNFWRNRFFFFFFFFRKLRGLPTSPKRYHKKEGQAPGTT